MNTQIAVTVQQLLSIGIPVLLILWGIGYGLSRIYFNVKTEKLRNSIGQLETEIETSASAFKILETERNELKDDLEKARDKLDKKDEQLQDSASQHQTAIAEMQQKIEEQKQHYERILEQYGHRGESLIRIWDVEDLFEVRFISKIPDFKIMVNGRIKVVGPDVPSDFSSYEMTAYAEDGPITEKNFDRDNRLYKWVMEQRRQRHINEQMRGS